VEFDVGDITALAEPAASYDKVIVIRVLINLADWTSQLKGLKECARVLKPGGVLVVSEATLQGWRNLNAFRHEWGLPNIPVPPFNYYVDEDKLPNAVPDLRLLEIVNFSSTYYVGTRVLKPLLIQALRAEIDVANPNMHWNRWFAQLASGGDYGTQKLFLFQKTLS
jgi:SAM-dependent methyltransferase